MSRSSNTATQTFISLFFDSSHPTPNCVLINVVLTMVEIKAWNYQGISQTFISISTLVLQVRFSQKKIDGLGRTPSDDSTAIKTMMSRIYGGYSLENGLTSPTGEDAANLPTSNIAQWVILVLKHN